ncbi:MAG: hypothetical protein Ta2A_21290 [Treponemataceae bacterium]|nr:MAG: hypothetical protein Ta2A_21290 [Treponemataceae bacterium]
MKQKYQSEALGVIYEDALAGFRVGAISEAELLDFAQDCLVPEVPHVSFSANDVSMRHHSPIAAHSARN